MLIWRLSSKPCGALSKMVWRPALMKEGEVTVTGDIIENKVTDGVKDHGEGILPEHLPFIFDPFFTTKFNRLGLGLTMAQRIVQGT